MLQQPHLQDGPPPLSPRFVKMSATAAKISSHQQEFNFPTVADEAPPRPAKPAGINNHFHFDHAAVPSDPGLPPPRPPKNSGATLTRRSSTSSSPVTQRRAIPDESDVNDTIIAKLMNLGYSHGDVMRALTVAKNDVMLAKQILENYVPAST